MKKYVFGFLIATIQAHNLPAQEVLRVKHGAIFTIQSGAQVTILGGAVLENGSTLTNSGKITLRRNNISGQSDWIDSTVASYNYGGGTLVFNSGLTQLINTKNTFGRIEVNTANLNLACDIDSKLWHLTNGKVNTGVFRAIASSGGQFAVEADSVSNVNFTHGWINGNLRRSISPFKIDSYMFPVGTTANSNVAAIYNLRANPLNNVTYLDAFFGPKQGTDSGLHATEGGAVYVAVNSGGVWNLTPNIQPTAGKYDLLLYFNRFTGLTDNAFASLQRPVGSSNGADWIVPAGSTLPATGSPGRTLASGYARRNGISSFSQFGIGMIAVKGGKVSFDVQRISGNQVQLNWDLPQGMENNEFEIERRLDNEQFFSSVGTVNIPVAAENNDTSLNFHFTDANDYAGISYYRIKKLHTENHDLANMIKAVGGLGEPGITVSLYPNPNRGQFTIRVDGSGKMYKVLITDESGRTIKGLNISGNNNVNVSGLGSGLYIIQIPYAFGKEKSFVQKVVVVP